MKRPPLSQYSGLLMEILGDVGLDLTHEDPPLTTGELESRLIAMNVSVEDIDLAKELHEELCTREFSAVYVIRHVPHPWESPNYFIRTGPGSHTLSSTKQRATRLDYKEVKEALAEVRKGWPMHTFRKVRLVPVDPTVAMQRKQALAILTSLGAWCEASTGRGISARKVDGRWQATLLEVDRRSAGGESITDALAQIANVVALETEAG